MTVTDMAQPVLSFRDVLRIDVIHALAQILGLVLSGGLAGLLGVRLVFIGCALLAGLLASARLFLHIGRGAAPTATASAAG